jgi:hypothetical protein
LEVWGSIPPEGVRHAATDDDAQTQTELEESVAKGGAKAFATDFATVDESDSDLNWARGESAWRSGERNGESVSPTPTTGYVDDELVWHDLEEEPGP